MNIRTLMLSAACAVTAAGAGTGAAQAQDGACDRQCLDGVLQQYLDAVLAHDPDAAPLFVGYRHTENAIATVRGEGVWENLDGIGPMQRRIYDPETGQTAWFGSTDMNDEKGLASVRLKIVDGEVTEAEWNVVQRADTGMDGAPNSRMFDVDQLIETPPPEFRVVPEEDRLSREALVALTNAYFDGIVHENPDLIPAKPGCRRLENGLLVTGGDLSPAMHGGHEGKVDCTTQGPFDIAFTAARRFPVVDVEQQVSFALGVFLRDPGAPKRRNYFGEYFWFEDGQIAEVYSAMSYLGPTEPAPNWPPYDGNFTIPREVWNAQ